MKINIYDASDFKNWRDILDRFKLVDVCQTPEYHSTYLTRNKGAEALLWTFEDGDHFFCYPFLKSPVVITSIKSKLSSIPTNFSDISSVYGYSGPLSTSKDVVFLRKAWSSFDAWCQEQGVIAEFLRFSIYVKNEQFAHPETTIEVNRSAAVLYCMDSYEKLLLSLDPKTRNMIRKAQKNNLVFREMHIKDSIEEFQSLYISTMGRNSAPDFFLYDKNYFEQLMKLPDSEIKLYGVFLGTRLISAAIVILYQGNALYHLGASLAEYSSLGANNLLMYEISHSLSLVGVTFLNLGGGRTLETNDPLLLFKRKNANKVENFLIGKRIVDKQNYLSIKSQWEKLNQMENKSPNLIFYR